MAEQRKDSRSAASLKVKYKSASVDEFAHQFGTDVSRSGIFIKTKSPLEAGALLKLELQLNNATAVIAGVGRVAWRRASSTDPSRPPGMGIKFIKLEPASQAIVDRIVAERGATPSRFDLSDDAEHARLSMDPPAPSVPSPAPSQSGPQARPAPAQPAPAQPAARMSATAAPVAKPAPTPTPTPAATSAAAAASNRPRIGPTKATVPSGLFAHSPLVQTSLQPAPTPERTSFFPPAPVASTPSMRPGGSGSTSSSGSLSAPRAPGSSPNARAAAARASMAPAPQKPGPKGVFGGAPKPSTLASSASGTRPAKEVSGLSSSSLFTDRSGAEPAPVAPGESRGPSDYAMDHALDDALNDVLNDVREDAQTNAIARPPARDQARVQAAPSTAPSRGQEDGMFATLEPGSTMASLPQAPDAFGEQPTTRSSRPSAQSIVRGVDELFADLESEDAELPPVQRPPAAAVFTPGSPQPSRSSIPAPASIPPEDADDLLSGFDEEELAEDAQLPPGPPYEEESLEDSEDESEEATGEGVPALLEPADGAPQKSRSVGVIALIVVLVLIAVAAGIAFLQPQLLVQWGLVQGPQTDVTATTLPSAAPSAAAPAQAEAPTAAPTGDPAQPTAEPTAEAAPAGTPEPGAEPGAVQPAQAAPTAQAAPAPQPTGAAGFATVNVTALPRGAEVRIIRNGGSTLAGVAPTNIELPIGSEVTVAVSAEGYATLSKAVTAERDNEPLRFKLEPFSYVLVVRAPEGAEVAVGSVTGISPAPLLLGHLAGDINVSVGKDGYRRMTRPVRLEEFTEKDGVLRAEIEVSLSPMPGATSAVAAPTPAPPPAPRRSKRPSRASATTPSAPEAAAPAPEAAPAPSPSEPEAAPAPAPPAPPTPPTPPPLP